MRVEIVSGGGDQPGGHRIPTLYPVDLKPPDVGVPKGLGIGKTTTVAGQRGCGNTLLTGRQRFGLAACGGHLP